MGLGPFLHRVCPGNGSQVILPSSNHQLSCLTTPFLLRQVLPVNLEPLSSAGLAGQGATGVPLTAPPPQGHKCPPAPGFPVGAGT